MVAFAPPLLLAPRPSLELRSSFPSAPSSLAVQPRRRPPLRPAMCKDSDGDGGIDWDGDWKEYRGRAQQPGQRDAPPDNVFRLGVTEPPEKNEIDERTEKLTNAWTSEKGFLVGMIFIALIAAGEGYVWWSSTQPVVPY